MIKIAGLQKMTLLDYPGKIAATVFLGGCNFHCGYCHNADLVEIKATSKLINTQDFFDFLQKRLDQLDGICVSGGEPLIYQDLPGFLSRIKEYGYAIKLDTNGAEFNRLNEIIGQKLVDYIAMDIKGSAENYAEITKNKVDLEEIKKSIDLIRNSGLEYEFRTTVLPKYHNELEMEKIGQMIKGAAKYYLQNFRNRNTLDPDFIREKCFTPDQLEKLRQIAQKYVAVCEIRN